MSHRRPQVVTNTPGIVPSPQKPRECSSTRAPSSLLAPYMSHLRPQVVTHTPGLVRSPQKPKECISIGAPPSLFNTLNVASPAACGYQHPGARTIAPETIVPETSRMYFYKSAVLSINALNVASPAPNGYQHPGARIIAPEIPRMYF